MAQRYDKLGRRIPEFDRSAAAKKSAATNKEKDENYYNKLGASGGKHRTRGYFGKLKDEGNVKELQTISKEARAKQAGHFKTLKDEGKIKELKAISKKGATARSQTVRGGSDTPLSGGQS